MNFLCEILWLSVTIAVLHGVCIPMFALDKGLLPNFGLHCLYCRSDLVFKQHLFNARIILDPTHILSFFPSLSVA